MRETKYIGWNGAQWLPVIELHQDYDYAAGIYSPTKLSAKLFDGSYVKLDIQTGQFPLRQYTGVHDKNGVEIYEEDTLRWGEKNYVVTRLPGGGLVAWVSEEEWFMLDARLTQLEVIGNIYEHKNLLKEVSS